MDRIARDRTKVGLIKATPSVLWRLAGVNAEDYDGKGGIINSLVAANASSLRKRSRIKVGPV